MRIPFLINALKKCDPFIEDVHEGLSYWKKKMTNLQHFEHNHFSTIRHIMYKWLIMHNL